MDFGYTNDQALFEAAVMWRDAAIADGWDARATYDCEPFERASTLTRNGFVAQIITRKDVGKWKFSATISVWGPDGLAINPPNKYKWESISEGISTCNYCGATGVETHRVGFAGRVCLKCKPEISKKVEYPGWTK